LQSNVTNEDIREMSVTLGIRFMSNDAKSPAPVTVVVPTYNRADCVRNAVDSVLAQGRLCREIIVIDDGSFDGTLNVLAPYGNAITVIRQENRGVSAARNAGIAAATSTWIAFLDSDDEWEPQRLQWFAEDLERWPEAVAHVGNARFISAGRELTTHTAVHGIEGGIEGAELLTNPLSVHLRYQFLTPTFIVRRDCLLSERGFDPSVPIFEDYRLFTKVGLRGNWVRRKDAVARIFRRGLASSNTFANLPEKGMRGAESFIDTYVQLLGREELGSKDRKLIRRRLSACRATLAAGNRDRGAWVPAAKGFARSIADFPTVTAVGRAVVGAICGTAGVQRLSAARHGQKRYDKGR